MPWTPDRVGGDIFSWTPDRVERHYCHTRLDRVSMSVKEHGPPIGSGVTSIGDGPLIGSGVTNIGDGPPIGSGVTDFWGRSIRLSGMIVIPGLTGYP